VINIGGRNIKVEGRLLRIARIDGDKYRFLENPDGVIEGIRSCGERIDLFTFVQRLPFSEAKYSYPMEPDNFAAISISTYEQWWMEQLGFKARNKAKQAGKKGVVIREVAFDDALAQGIWKIYNECPIRQGRKFPHYGKDFETVRREAATFFDSSVFIGAYFNEELIGFIKLTQDETGTQAGLMHIISMIQHRDKAPTNALVAQAVRSCADRKIQYLVYSNFAYGNKLRDSLSDFKERNGFQRMDVPRYYVPLTPLGQCAFRLGLHRRMVDLFPESVLSKLRELRNSWYSRRFQIASEV
jgi:hypothetical protein